jgi:prepilin-type N-terminal cleavage/methylation domain-containing protein
MKAKRHGFTLIELVVVMALLALVLAIGIPKYAELKQKQSVEADLRSVELLEQAETTYFHLKQQHTFNTDDEQTTETFTASMQELSSVADFQGFKVLEDPYWDEQDDRWVISYTEGDGYSFEAEAGEEVGNGEDPGDEEEEGYPAWDSSKKYKKGNKVIYDGKAYEAKKGVKAGKVPSENGKDWKDITN